MNLSERFSGVESNIADMLSYAAQAELIRAEELRRPFFLLRPPVFLDGDQWCALLGENLQVGVAGFGDSPHLASLAFDDAWLGKEAPDANTD